MSLFSIGLSGIKTSQVALNTTGHNIANADTDGYSRQEVVQTAAEGQFSGVGFLGQGTTVADVRRVYSEYLNTQVRSSTGLDSEAQAYLTQVNQTDQLLADSTTGLSSTLSSFFDAVQNAAENPDDSSARSLLLSDAEALAERFNSVNSQLSEQNSYVNSQLQTMAQQATDLASSIADYNQAITETLATGATPNDLMDARDQALVELSELVGVSVVEQDGNYNVFLSSSGQSLVVGSEASTLSAEPSQDDPGQFGLMLHSGQTEQDISSAVSGGAISGLLRFRSEVLNPAINEVGRLATVLADQVNSQLGQGLDLDGNFGSNLFADINSASAVAQRSIAQEGNAAGSGNLDVYIEDSTALTGSDYEVTFTSATGYSIRRLSDNEDLGSFDLSDSPAATIDGFSLTLPSGSVQAGDQFTIQPVTSGAKNIEVVMSDPDALALAGAIQDSATAGNSDSGSIDSVTPETLDVQDSAYSTQTAALESGLPVRLVFAAASSGTQAYEVYDSAGNSIGSGSIVPGQENSLTLSVGSPAVDVAVTLSGSPDAGDSFNLSFNSEGESDNRNALALANLQTDEVVDGETITNAYSGLVSTVGQQASQAALDASATEAIRTQAEDNRASVSGVNLDEEAANLVEFQQYYTAAAQVLKAAQSTFDTLINAF